MDKNKIIVATVFVGFIALFFYLRGYEYLSFENLKESRVRLLAKVESNVMLAALLFLGVYISVTALSLPGALVMTLASGALFGFLRGTILASFASTIGATVAFGMSRFLFRDYVEEKFGTQLRKVREGLDRDGALYLFAIRSIPVIPFFVVNVVMGLSKMRAVQFALVSQIAMLPGTAVYVNAGKEISNVNSSSEIVNPRLLFALLLLGLIPLLLKWVLAKLKPEEIKND